MHLMGALSEKAVPVPVPASASASADPLFIVCVSPKPMSPGHERARRTCIRILARSSGATHVLESPPATPPAISSCGGRGRVYETQG